ncbi:hypothetical protein E4633_04000 [Geomonas terrae]|uniref:Uncharacterized protein n=1 Tax=Geomonas terrae TaxID=2562681 RepID=A0A4S1CLJ1_9BACT|nr:hypothetical protein [Geomonas terrae]TGU74634.1 hypothetical protein E4633_04000 [Geomonas terrae]
MELLDKLAETARRQHEEADLPASLLKEILEIASDPALGRDGKLVELLLEQIEAFDSYAGAGCFGDAVSATTIQATLDRMRGKG